ncbi:hypothetical protein ACC733_38095, partial [Rhizobium johnstonii]|uniref:hypothetical protein n=1 Tax=Rhizobium johnstonii TaxID=3019933 RepID=UPI003F963EBE
GEVILGFVTERLKTVSDILLGASSARRLDLTVKTPDRLFTEEERSKMPTVFTLRARCATTFSIIRIPESPPSVMIDSGWKCTAA